MATLEIYPVAAALAMGGPRDQEHLLVAGVQASMAAEALVAQGLQRLESQQAD